MDFDGTPAICSTAAYEPYLQLSAFPPAQAYCSNLSSESPIQVGDPTCASGSDRCILLSYLQAADPTFAQTVCCCIGDCHKSESTVISIATNPPPNTSSASSKIGSAGSVSSVQSESPGVVTSSSTTTDVPTSSSFSVNSLSNSLPGGSPSILSSRSLSTSTSSAELPTSSSLLSSSTTSQTHTYSTISTSRKRSTSPSTGKSSSTRILSSGSSPSASETSPSSSNPPTSTASHTTSYSTCATCSYPTPTAACTKFNGYEQYHSGQCYIENTNNPGNVDPLYPPIYSTYPGTLNACDAATICALGSEGFDPNVYASFDLHYLCSNSSWVCVQYYGANFRASYFDVQDFDVVVAYGYYGMRDHD
ncbi:hypothetical protein HO173_012589 [Letharia columbiana]|uniref:Uncharacterized protein n=1 Tax=Letharia columbiana TaxID=112416 RepID=A0A8H6CML0_9LECA|nr:uncharacterized protein HO173_012589 [Letharia columbiana]KAF6225999.1 hypothetical protein HO173_012589 [Letharia columbiana]